MKHVALVSLSHAASDARSFLKNNEFSPFSQRKRPTERCSFCTMLPQGCKDPSMENLNLLVFMHLLYFCVSQSFV